MDSAISSHQDIEKKQITNDESEYPSKKVVIPALLAGYLVVFLVALDRTILETAIQSISNEFQSFGDISWYEAVIVVLTIVFEVGCVICAGCIFVTVCQTLLQNRLVTGLEPLGIDSAAIAGAGATSLRSLVPENQLQEVLIIYNDASMAIWYLGLELSVLTLLAAFAYEWKNVKKEEEKQKLDEKKTKSDEA